MAVDWVELSRAVPYAGTAIIFGIFMVIIIREMAKNQREERKTQDAKDERRDTAFLAAMERRDTEWRAFLAQQQASRADSWKEMAGELRQLSALVGHSTDLLREHDAWERGLLTTIQQRRTDTAYARRASDKPAEPGVGTDA